MATSVSFASNSLQTANIIVSDVDHYGVPTKDVKIYPLAHANRSKIPYSSFPTKTIPVSGTIVGTSPADLDNQIDIFKSYLNGTEQNLDIGYNGSTRRYIATLNSCSIERPNGLVKAKFKIEFICSSPYGMNTTTTTALSAAGRTLNTYSDSYTFIGTAPYLAPIATITYSAITGTTGSVSWGNGGTGQQITVTRTWATTDILVIDCGAKSVKVNGVDVNFTGAFPEFPPVVSSAMQYNDSFTTRTFGISVVYTPAYT